jgi:putative ABC transport system permease protein
VIPPTLFNVGRRYLLRHPWQTVLMIVGIMLGVAVMVAIDIANSAASRAFDLSTESVAGKSTHQVVGGPGGLDEAVYASLKAALPEYASAPVVADYVTSPELGDRPLQLLGVDPFAEAPFRSYLVAEGAGSVSNPVDVGQLVTFLTRPGALLISEGVAEDYGLEIGDEVALNASGRMSTGFVAGLLRPEDRVAQRALEGVILADIATAQEALDQVGRLSHVDLIVPEGDAQALDRIRGVLPADARALPVAARTGAIEQMTAAFRTNLTALSLLALVVGTFLIYNSMTFSVVQRRPLFGTLRCLGVTRGEIARMVLGEAALVGVIGSMLGIGLGILLGQGAVRLVTQTINDLYFVVTVRGIVIPPESLIKGALAGAAATVASALAPAWEAASIPPRMALSRSGLEDRARRLLPALTLGGLGGIALGIGLLLVPTRSLEVSFAGLFALTVGFALLAPITTVLISRAVLPMTNRIFGAPGRMAPRSVTGALSRTAVAIAALMVAVSVTVGVGLMVGSFRTTVVDWLGQTLWGDVYISAPSITATRSPEPLDPRVVEIVANWRGAQRQDTLRSTDVSSPQGSIGITAVSDEDFTTPRIFISTDGTREDMRRAVENGAVLASEPLANRLGLPSRDARITLYTDQGPREFPIAGIYRDYSSSQGSVMMGLDLYQQYWNDPTITAALLVLKPGEDVDATVRALRESLSGVQGVIVRPNAALRNDALVVFDRAFAITGALQLLAAIVAFIGVLAALLSLQLERAREMGLMRAVGLTVEQLRGLVFLETGLMGAVAGLLALPTGLALAIVLIFIINRRSFGWTMQLFPDPVVFIQALALAIIAALLAGIYPAIRMGRMAAAEALRGE